MSIASVAFSPKKAVFEANLHYLHVFSCGNQTQGSCSGRCQSYRNWQAELRAWVGCFSKKVFTGKGREEPTWQEAGSQRCKGKQEAEEGFFQTAVSVQNQAKKSPGQFLKPNFAVREERLVPPLSPTILNMLNHSLMVSVSLHSS